jgi:hypothetical protein
MNENRFIIAYFHSGFPGERGELLRFENLESAEGAFHKFSYEGWVSDSVNASLYGDMTDSDWADAKDFETIGCPFDYPSWIMTINSDGFVVTENC